MDVVSAPKPVQGQITVTQLMALPACLRVIGKNSWTKQMRDGVADVFRNRRFIDQNGANKTDSNNFAIMSAKIAKLLRTSKEVSSLLFLSSKCNCTTHLTISD